METKRTCKTCGKTKKIQKFPKTHKIYRMHTCRTCFNKKRTIEYLQYRKIISAAGITFNIYNQKYKIPCENCNKKTNNLKYYTDIHMVLCDTCRTNIDLVCGHIKEMVIA